MSFQLHRNAVRKMPKKTAKHETDTKTVTTTKVIGGAMETAKQIAGDEGMITVHKVSQVSIIDTRGYGPKSRYKK